MIEPLPLAQFAADTLGIVRSPAYVRVMLPTELAWLLGILLATGAFVIVQTAVAMAAAVLDRARGWL